MDYASRLCLGIILCVGFTTCLIRAQCYIDQCVFRGDEDYTCERNCRTKINHIHQQSFYDPNNLTCTDTKLQGSKLKEVNKGVIRPYGFVGGTATVTNGLVPVNCTFYRDNGFFECVRDARKYGSRPYRYGTDRVVWYGIYHYTDGIGYNGTILPDQASMFERYQKIPAQCSGQDASGRSYLFVSLFIASLALIASHFFLLV